MTNRTTMKMMKDIEPEDINWKNGIAWSRELETGYEKIDTQHKQLFKMVSDLIESCQRKDSRITIEETLLFLVEYTAKHFADEEKIALLYKYPQFAEHRRMHVKFTELVGNFVKQYEEDGDSESLSTTVHKVIVSWLIQHIQGEDAKIAYRIKLLTSSS